MRYLKNLTLTALLALGLSGCSMFGDDKDGDLMAQGGMTATAVTVVPADKVVVRVAKPTPVQAAPIIQMQYIDIGPVLDKLDDMGCVVDTLELREVKRGGHASIKCVKKIDALNADMDSL